MSKFISRLLAAGGETSVHTLLGAWRQKVSSGLQSSHPPQSPPKPFSQTAYSSGGAGQALAAGTNIVMDTPGYGDIPYNEATGVWTLEANKNYRLTARFALVDYTGETTNMGIEWVNAANAVLHADHEAFLTPGSNTNNLNSQPTAETFHTTGGVAELVHLRVTGATGTATANPGLSYALVEEL